MHDNDGAIIMDTLLHRVFGSATANGDAVSTAPMSVQIMALCATANFVSHLGVMHDFALSSKLASAVLSSIRSDKSAVRMMAATG